MIWTASGVSEARRRPATPGGSGSPVRMTGMSIVRIGAAGMSTAGARPARARRAEAPTAVRAGPGRGCGGGCDRGGGDCGLGRRGAAAGCSAGGGGSAAGGGAVTAGWIRVGSQRRYVPQFEQKSTSSFSVPHFGQAAISSDRRGVSAAPSAEPAVSSRPSPGACRSRARASSPRSARLTASWVFSGIGVSQ